MNISLVIVGSNTAQTVSTTRFLKTLPDINIAFTAINGHDFLIKLHNHKLDVDLIVMDIEMSKIDGCTASFYLK